MMNLIRRLRNKVDFYIRGAAVPESDFPIANWYVNWMWEPHVMLAIRDLVQPGDIAFDVGANAGALSGLMSRIVGPKGTVCGFEASRRIIEKTTYNMRKNLCNNVYLYHRAVSDKSGERLKLYTGVDPYSDSLIGMMLPEQRDTSPFVEVLTIALDDFCDVYGLYPAFIKFDIEKAEYLALKGATRLMAEHKPHMVLEQSPHEDFRCIELLLDCGYLIFDLANYKRVKTLADFDPRVRIANIVAIHETKLCKTPFENFSIEPFKTIAVDDPAMKVSENGSYTLKLNLPAGRYLIEGDMKSINDSLHMSFGVKSWRNNYSHSYSQLDTTAIDMVNSYRWITIELNYDEELDLQLGHGNPMQNCGIVLKELRISKINWNHPKKVDLSIELSD